MRTSSLIPAGLCALLLSACSYAGNDSAASHSERGDTAAAQQAEAPAETPLFIQTTPESYPTPDTTMRGRFEVRQGCLTFVTAEAGFRAVLPAGSEFRPPATVVLPGGREVPLGEAVVVKGGEGEFGPASAVPATCPQRAMLIGGVA